MEIQLVFQVACKIVSNKHAFKLAIGAVFLTTHNFLVGEFLHLMLLDLSGNALLSLAFCLSPFCLFSAALQAKDFHGVTKVRSKPLVYCLTRFLRRKSIERGNRTLFFVSCGYVLNLDKGRKHQASELADCLGLSWQPRCFFLFNWSFKCLPSRVHCWDTSIKSKTVTLGLNTYLSLGPRWSLIWEERLGAKSNLLALLGEIPSLHWFASGFDGRGVMAEGTIGVYMRSHLHLLLKDTPLLWAINVGLFYPDWLICHWKQSHFARSHERTNHIS